MKYIILFLLFKSCNFSNQDSKDANDSRTDQNATLLGIDSDNDGVRDDVQAWIERNYSSKPATEKATKIYAKALQFALANKDNKQSSIEASKLVLKASDCLHATTEELGIAIEDSIEIAQKIRLLHFNTKERIDAQKKLNENFSGSSYTLKSKSEACNLK